MTTPLRTRPTVIQRLAYVVGRPLPPQMQDWVRNDILGPGGVRRYLLHALPGVVGLGLHDDVAALALDVLFCGVDEHLATSSTSATRSRS